MQRHDLLAIASKASEFDYSPVLRDDVYEYRWVTLPHFVMPHIPFGVLLTETDWRHAGIMMSRGWQHYDWHTPERNILLFRRVRETDPSTGEAPSQAVLLVQQRNELEEELEMHRSACLEESD